MSPGDRVRVKSNGRQGTVVGELSGFWLVRVDGWDKDYGYRSQEIEPVESEEEKT